MTYNSKKYHAEYYQQNKEKILKQNNEWRKRNREHFKEMSRQSWHKRKHDPANIKKMLLRWAEARAKTKQLPFNLVEDDIILPNICPILKVPFDRSSKRYTYSLDRIIPELGYTKNNIWVISAIANSMKWNSTHEERIKFAEWVLEGGYPA